MKKDWREPTEGDSIECHLQQEGMGTLLCRGVQHTGRNTTNAVTPTICFNCDAGRIYREIGCDSVTPRLRLLTVVGGVIPNLEGLFCHVRKRDTTLDCCRTCELVSAETTKALVTSGRGLFERHSFYSAYRDLEAAREAMRDGEYERVITRSVACLESVMRICHEQLGQSLPSGKHVSGLWGSTRDLLRFAELANCEPVVNLVNALGGVVIQLGGLRNALSDAHGRGLQPPVVSQATAELCLNTAMTLATALVRRFIEIKEEEHGDEPT